MMNVRHFCFNTCSTLCRATFAVTGLLGVALAQAQTAEPSTPQRVEVVGTAPLPGPGTDRNLLPYATQVLRRGNVDAAQADNLTDLLARRLSGVQVNEVQGNLNQADLSFRGHRASGLLGATQGLSVYLDGVRMNEPFGDIVNWDLVPEFALDSIALVPGANPAFGLNTLGGAISMRSASGLSAPGLRLDTSLGSFGRHRLDLSHGSVGAQGWHSYVAASGFAERGWRDHSPGRLANVLLKLGRRAEGLDWSLSALVADSVLYANGLVPSLAFESGQSTPDLLAQRRNSIYTHPDRTHNRLSQLTLNLGQDLHAGMRLNALAYLRNSRRDGFTGDVAPADEDHPDAASLNRTATRQSAWGGAAGLAARSGAHQWQVGVSVDASRIRYRQTEQAGHFDASRGVLVDTPTPTLSATVQGRAIGLGGYASDTWALAPGRTLTATLRANHSSLENQLTSRDDDDGILRAHAAERFTYRSLNPALGLAERLAEGVIAFVNLARNTRVPTAIELGCADPDQPCRLPAGLQADPYLRQVRSHNLEFGLRWLPAPGQRLEVAAWRIRNRDDILFGSVSASSQLGYFSNFPLTRYQGLDAQWQARLGAWDWQLGADWLDARYQARGSLRAGERNVQVQPGTRMAGLSRGQLKLSVDWRAEARFTLGADWQAVGRRGVQGNEDQRLADDDFTRHNLDLPGHAVLNLRASWSASPGWQWLLKVNNATQREFDSFAALGSTQFDAQGRRAAPRQALFVAPAAPRSLFLGLSLRP